MLLAPLLFMAGSTSAAAMSWVGPPELDLGVRRVAEDRYLTDYWQRWFGDDSQLAGRSDAKAGGPDTPTLSSDGQGNNNGNNNLGNNNGNNNLGNNRGNDGVGDSRGNGSSGSGQGGASGNGNGNGNGNTGSGNGNGNGNGR